MAQIGSMGEGKSENAGKSADDGVVKGAEKDDYIEKENDRENTRLTDISTERGKGMDLRKLSPNMGKLSPNTTSAKTLFRPKTASSVPSELTTTSSRVRKRNTLLHAFSRF